MLTEKTKPPDRVVALAKPGLEMARIECTGSVGHRRAATWPHINRPSGASARRRRFAKARHRRNRRAVTRQRGFVHRRSRWRRYRPRAERRAATHPPRSQRAPSTLRLGAIASARRDKAGGRPSCLQFNHQSSARAGSSRLTRCLHAAATSHTQRGDAPGARALASNSAPRSRSHFSSQPGIRSALIARLK